MKTFLQNNKRNVGFCLRQSYVLLTLALLSLSACNRVRRSIDETLHPKAQKTTPQREGRSVSSAGSSTSVTTSSTLGAAVDTRSIFESTERLDSIQAQLQALPHLKGKKLMFFQGFFFYDFQGGMIIINLQDPDKPENIDVYTYKDGTWQEPKPLKTTGQEALAKAGVNMFMPLDQIRFSTAKKIYAFAQEKAKTIEGAEPILYVNFNQLRTRGFALKEWYILVNGTRHNYSLKFDLEGNFKEMY
ncbi:hypothetical protein DBR32_12440 [Taibaiella sp. KBW10]|uniref:hypothetical protein n=1 Tax=Taibaiella sp. KBW10 TaxID=2153357 RepID=UPI000F5B3378|nr:hypothetical protein [Taibaiella sp. KBW10]RQO30372.1 hypothetical protein DBR32_12440 [Taibaiella sp. KBW10]